MVPMKLCFHWILIEDVPPQNYATFVVTGGDEVFLWVAHSDVDWGNIVVGDKVVRLLVNDVEGGLLSCDKEVAATFGESDFRVHLLSKRDVIATSDFSLGQVNQCNLHFVILVLVSDDCMQVGVNRGQHEPEDFERRRQVEFLKQMNVKTVFPFVYQ